MDSSSRNLLVPSSSVTLGLNLALHFQSILELGCGPGDLAAFIVPLHADYLRVDLVPAEIETARKRYPYLKFEVESAYEVASHAGRFDLGERQAEAYLPRGRFGMMSIRS